MRSSKPFIRKSVIATLSVAMISGLASFASSAAWAAKPFPLPPMLHFTPIAPNTPTIQIKPMAPWNANQLLDPDSPGGPAWGGLFDVEALGMSQDNPTSPQPGCDYWPSKAQSIAWWEKQPANQALSNLQKYPYGTPQHFQWVIGTEYSHQDAMGWQYAACPPPPTTTTTTTTTAPVTPIGSFSLYGNTVTVNNNGTAQVCTSNGTCQTLTTTTSTLPNGGISYNVSGISGNQSASINTNQAGTVTNSAWINPDTIYNVTSTGVIANPNCTGSTCVQGSAPVNTNSNASLNGGGTNLSNIGVSNVSGTTVSSGQSVK